MSIYISASSLKDYIECSQKVYYRLDKQVVQTQTREMHIGLVTHSILEHGWRDLDTACDLLDSKLVSENLTKADAELVYGFIRTFFESFRPYIGDNDLIEYKFKVKLQDGVYLVGKMDRISDGNVYDWKTTARPPKSISDDVQFMLYESAYRTVFKESPKSVAYASLSQGKFIPYVSNKHYEYEVFNKIIPNMIRDMRSGNYFREGIFRSKCYRCPYKEVCLDGVNDELDYSEFAS